MKIPILLFVLVFGSLGFVLAQNKIEGRIVDLSNQEEVDIETQLTATQNDSILPFEYKIILRKNQNEGRIKTIYKGRSQYFSIELPAKTLNNFNWIEFKAESKESVVLSKDSFFNSNRIVVFTKEKEVVTIRVHKPAIYIYPESPTEVNIIHHYKGKVLNTYPIYDSGWNVTAYPDGKLLNQADNRYYEYLFWDGECKFDAKHYQYTSGFYIHKKEVIPFLMKQLQLLQLNEKEINDFIVYWLPELSKNEWNFVHFWINDDIDNTSKLIITPKPDNLIRVYMEYQAISADKLWKLPQQTFPKIERRGFTVLEWGGGEVSEYNSSL